MKKADRQDFWKLGIIFIAAILRVFRLESLTVFLGDQGRTMLVMKDFVEHGVIPLAGPTTLTGHHLGPIFYYLLVPGYLISQGPIGVSLWMAILGVVATLVLYETITLMFGVRPARAVSLLWAVSPYLVAPDRVIWEPNLVPLFSLLFIYLLYRAHHLWKPWLWIALGSVVGVLLQLHYPNIFFIGLTGGYFVGVVIIRMRKVSEVVIAGAWWFVGCVIMLAPFLWYEYLHGFTDITGVVSVIANGGSMHIGKRAMLDSGLDYAYRVFGRAFPYMSRQPAVLLLGLTALFTLWKRSKKNIFFAGWIFGGIAAMTRYSGVVHDHYLYFLIPVPFLFIGSVLSILPNVTWQKVGYGIVAVLCAVQLYNTDMLKPANDDIHRVSTSVQFIKKVIKQSSFSFTLVNSPSFSDLHYRYYMKVMNLTPKPVTDKEYPLLVVVCDEKKCPSAMELINRNTIPAICFDYHCEGTYPEISLVTDWAYVNDWPVWVNGAKLGRLYVFDRR